MRDECLVLQFVLYGELVHPALMSGPHLVPADHYEDAGQPVGDQDEAGHQQAEDHSAVLRKSGAEDTWLSEILLNRDLQREPLNLLKNPRQSDKSCQLQKLHRIEIVLEEIKLLK